MAIADHIEPPPREAETGHKIYLTAFEAQWLADTVAEASEIYPRLRALKEKLAWAAQDVVERLTRETRGAR